MTPAVEVSGLSFGFGQRPVLRDVSFSVTEGERAGILGANGAGKSTLLWCLLGLLRANGSVRLFGEVPGAASRARVGAVFQNPEDQLFMPTLLDDLTLPLMNRGMAKEGARTKALAVLRQVDLEDYAAEPAAHLSLGQRKRASVSLALIGDPSLLVLDEPTAELDPRSIRQLTALLAALPMSRLIASHHFDFLRDATDRLLVLSGGRIVASGPTPEILADTALLCAAGLL